MADIQQRIACKAIIVKNDKILLMRESAAHDTNFKAGRYQFPGGRIEPGEAFQDGLKREIREETGLEIGIGEPLFVGEWFPVIKDVPQQIVGIFFLCNAEATAVKLSEEHDDYKWVNLEESKTLPIMTPDDRVVEKYFSRR